MARPRTFDEGRALDAAMRAFWVSGYGGTSTEDLCAATGMGRSSIYNTFTGKRELFLAALRHYVEEMTGRTAALLDEPRPIRERIRDVFWQSVEPDPADPVGCFVVNSVVEFGMADPDVVALLQRDGERRFAQFRDAFIVAQRAGEIDPGRDPAALARFVGATVSGLRVTARAGADRAVLEAVAETALAAF